MAKPRWGHVLRRVHSLLDEGIVPALSDRELLERYVKGGRESAEPAFAALVDRHGAMVLRVCRHVLQDEHAAQDAFQATFLVLARRAARLWVHDSLAPWLHGVAYRTSACARGAAARRRRHERIAAEQAPRDVAPAEPEDLPSILHQEIDRLPERYRAPIILCYLEGLTHDQAAERLRCPVGTVRSRLATGRERLRRRLTIRGLAPGHGLREPAASTERSADVVPAALAGSAVRNAQIHSGATGAGAVPAAVAALADRGMRFMWLSRLRILAVALMCLGGTAAGVFAFVQRQGETPGPDQPKGPTAQAPAPRAERTFLEARIETAREILKQDLDRLRFQVGTPGSATEIFDKIPIWSRRLMEDRLRLATNAAARLDAIREHRNRMITHERLVRGYTDAGQGRVSEALEARYFRLEADQILAEAGVDPAKEAPVAEPHPGPALPPHVSPAPTRR